MCFARGEAGRADKTSRPGNPLRGKQHTSALDRFVVQIVGKKTTQKKVARKMTGLVCLKLSGAFETARVAVVIEVRTECFWRTSRRKNIQKKYKIAKHRREISKSRDTNNLILWTHLRVYLQGSFPPDLHGEGKKKKKKKLNVLGDQTTSYSLCLEAARTA